MQKQIQEAYIVDAVRTPVGKAPRGVFKTVRPDDLLVHALQSLIQRVPQFDLTRVQDIIIGCAMPEAEQGMNVARIAALLAGIPNQVPAVTVNRFCSSGLQTVALAAEQIMLGEADCVIAGGVESMSMVPMGGYHLSHSPRNFISEEHVGISYGMGITAEKVASQWQITREQQDEFALSSHQKALHAIQQQEFQQEISPFPLKLAIPDLQSEKIKNIEKKIEHDEGPRADTTIEALANLKPVFSAKGTVTAGNSSQMSGGGR